MKTYIAVDFEGGACIVGAAGKTLTESKQYEFAQRVMTYEANAAVEGALEGGASEVVVEDAHGGGLNLLYEELHPEARVVLGTPRGRRFPALDSTFAGLALVGYHPMAGVEDGVLSHSYSSVAVQRMWLNGRELGEIGFDAALAGLLGVPVIFVSSCEAGVREAKGFLGEIETVATKKGLGRNSALSLHPEKARELIRQGMRRAVEQAKNFKPFKVDPPFELKHEYKLEHYAERGAGERLGPRTRLVRSDDLFSLI